MADSRSPWDIPSSWQPALEAARAGGTFLLLGGTDSGKSTLAVILANEAVGAGGAAAVVDADIGQSSVGPPACVGAVRVTAEVDSLEALRPDAIDFVGACSPAGHLVQCATSACAMAGVARKTGADTLIVDTTGLIAGPFARGLKGAKIRMLAPDLLIALQEDDEVEHLLAPYRSRATPRVLSLPVSRAAKERSREDRASRRQSKFGAYFSHAGSISLEWDKAPIENSPWTSGEPAPGHVRAYAEERLAGEVLYAERRADGLFLITAGAGDRDGLRALAEGFGGSARAVEVTALDHLLIGILGEAGQTLALGILEEIDFSRRVLSIFAPLPDPDAARGLRLGTIRIARDGTQLGSNEPGAVA